MIKKWIEYITENVDTDDFNALIYLRDDRSTEQFWLYINYKNLKPESSYPKGTNPLRTICQNIFSPVFVIMCEYDTEFNGKIRSYFDNNVMVYGLKYRDKKDDHHNVIVGEKKKQIIDKVKSYVSSFKMPGITKIDQDGKTPAAEVVQLQLIEVISDTWKDGGGIDIDIIDYYL